MLGRRRCVPCRSGKFLLAAQRPLRVRIPRVYMPWSTVASPPQARDPATQRLGPDQAFLQSLMVKVCTVHRPFPIVHISMGSIDCDTAKIHRSGSFETTEPFSPPIETCPFRIEISGCDIERTDERFLSGSKRSEAHRGSATAGALPCEAIRRQKKKVQKRMNGCVLP